MPSGRATILLASVSFFLLFGSFQWNLWHAAEEYFFAFNQKDTEALVIGRMVWTRQHGLLASAGLLGFVGTGPAVITFDTNELWRLRGFALQTQAYLQGIPIRSFSPYFSHSGLQGMAFATLDNALWFADPAFKLGLFRALTSALVAATYVLLVLWLGGEFGLGPALFSLLVMLASPWLTAFARNLYFSVWLFLLPALGIGAVLAAWSGRSNQNRRFAIVAFVTFLVRFLSGYEFVTCTVAMAVAPVLYYSIRDSWPLRVMLRRLGLLSGAALAALVVSLAVLTLQIASVTGSAGDAKEHIRLAIGRRMNGDPSKFPPAYSAALRAKTSDVLKAYIEDRFDRQNDPERLAPVRWLVSRRYSELIVWILLAAGWATVRTKRMPADRRRRPLALATATLCALLGTLAWLVIFKAHSFIHVQVNPLMWHLLFLPLGAALVCLSVQDAGLLLVQTLRVRRRRVCRQDPADQ